MISHNTECVLIFYVLMQENDCPSNNTKENMLSRLCPLYTNTFHVLFQGAWWSHQEEGKCILLSQWEIVFQPSLLSLRLILMQSRVDRGGK